MNYRRLGKSGLKVSEMSYGSWVTFSFQIGVESASKIMKHALDKGVNFLTMLKPMQQENLKLLWVSHSKTWVFPETHL